MIFQNYLWLPRFFGIPQNLRNPRDSLKLYSIMHDFLIFTGEDIQSAGAAVPVMDLSKASIALEDQDIVIG